MVLAMSMASIGERIGRSRRHSTSGLQVGISCIKSPLNSHSLATIPHPSSSVSHSSSAPTPQHSCSQQPRAFLSLSLHKMVSARFFAVLAAAAAAVSAAPIADLELPTNITEAVDRDLRNGEMVVFGAEGRSHIITEDTWALLLKTMDVLPEPPAVDEEWLKAAEGLAEIPVNVTEGALDKRDCNSNYQTVVDRTERFVDWDVQMSPVVIGAGSKGIDITISKSYAIANTVQVSAGIDLTFVKDRLKSSLGINYSRTWTTTQGYLIRGTVDAGYTGVVITRPWTNRRYGRTFQGCVGSLRQTGTFMADSREEGSYEGVSWVGGAITACLKKQTSLPLTRCNGSGAFR
ncbi:hypothetical protein CTA2_3560 [Colletotrichum tanaceti]|uniref:Uncharacterized protein n=1 Tax=Colletotrichum tanaceti TaxID=1306861 RepID=A0A4U6XE99_9PEZI|nr:hypothetical protein CTA2_3560 [Colletotrichum tanaceti]TKW54121.1 hypothetical protein CTA1_6042 [Colletotrichum tanaceti]